MSEEISDSEYSNWEQQEFEADRIQAYTNCFALDVKNKLRECRDGLGNFDFVTLYFLHSVRISGASGTSNYYVCENTGDSALIEAVIDEQMVAVYDYIEVDSEHLELDKDLTIKILTADGYSYNLPFYALDSVRTYCGEFMKFTGVFNFASILGTTPLNTFKILTAGQAKAEADVLKRAGMKHN